MVKVGDVTLNMIKLISYFSIVINAFNLYQVISNTDSIENRPTVLFVNEKGGRCYVFL